MLGDPVDRAYSNWMHLWSDGLETIPSFLAALHAEDSRVADGYPPFLHHRRLGLYGEQLEHLYSVFSHDQVHGLRHRQLVDEPHDTFAWVCAFLGVLPGEVWSTRPENVRPLVPDSAWGRALARVVRAEAWAGRLAPPQVWRQVSKPLLLTLHHGGIPRPNSPRLSASRPSRCSPPTSRSWNA